MYCFVKFMRVCAYVRMGVRALMRVCVYAPVCVRVVRVRAVYPIILPHFKSLFYNSLIFNHL